MKYEEAIDYIHSTQRFGSKLGLDNMRILLELMGNPHKKLKYVHVAGTNGKGSACAFISSILIEAGYRVGLYTSPALLRFSERIRINNKEIENNDVARITEFVKSAVDVMIQKGYDHPTEFELVTAIALQYYNECNCDIVVLEVGLGGRLDATNIIGNSLASVIMSISYDHMDRLGDTLEKIAYEKAGIIKQGGCAVVYSQEKSVEKVIIDACKKVSATCRIVDFSGLKLKSFDIDGQVFDFEDYLDLKIKLLGKHQLKNAAVAIKTIEILQKKGFVIDNKDIRYGLMKAEWPGRMEILNKNPVFIIDGAHNKDAAAVLCNNLKEYFPGIKITFIIGVMADKEYKEIIEQVMPVADRFIAISPKVSRALPAHKLADIIKCYCNEVYFSDTIDNAINLSLEKTASDGVICAMGSLYYIGEIRERFRR